MDHDVSVLYDLARELEASNDAVRAMRVHERVWTVEGNDNDMTDRSARLPARGAGGSPSDH